MANSRENTLGHKSAFFGPNSSIVAHPLNFCQQINPSPPKYPFSIFSDFFQKKRMFMFSPNKMPPSLLLLLLFGLLSISLFPPLVQGGNADDASVPSKMSSKKRDGVIENSKGANMANKGVAAAAGDNPPSPPAPAPAPAANCTCPESSTVAPGAETSSNGYGAGSIFVAILFGMGLMFALGQLYAFWEKRRLGDTPAYRGY